MMVRTTGARCVYISGPMRGFPYFNFPMFDDVAMKLRNAGVVVFNPSENDQAKYPDIHMWPGYAAGDTNLCPQFEIETALHWDFSRILEADGIVMLPGWRKSVSAKAERYVAEATGKTVYIWEPGVFYRATFDPIQRRMLSPEVRV